MDVNLLSRLLKELIIDNDRIPLPGMGYFQTEPMPAFFQKTGRPSTLHRSVFPSRETKGLPVT